MQRVGAQSALMSLSGGSNDSRYIKAGNRKGSRDNIATCREANNPEKWKKNKSIFEFGHF